MPHVGTCLCVIKHTLSNPYLIRIRAWTCSCLIGTLTIMASTNRRAI
jgi:hypothetical protein